MRVFSLFVMAVTVQASSDIRRQAEGDDARRSNTRGDPKTDGMMVNDEGQGVNYQRANERRYGSICTEHKGERTEITG